MSLHLNIPDSVLASLRLPENRIESELMKELAIALYSQDLLSFSKAKELSGLPSNEFSQVVGERGVSRRCGKHKINGEDVYVCSE